ncbi:MAG: hypothetical protein VX558_06045 [Actinomycetota bacterium]|nr:hypothetical protein [Actinomycetota bacterium]MEE3256176.1 hypothetical protein [Actinomycetota bacterium]
MSGPLERGELNGFHVVDPDLYDRYRSEVLALTNSYQVDINEFLPDDGTRKRGLSDTEIADQLGLDVRDVTEIRVVAEHDEYPIEEYEASARFKDAAAESYREGGVKNLYKGDPPPTRR